VCEQEDHAILHQTLHDDQPRVERAVDLFERGTGAVKREGWTERTDPGPSRLAGTITRPIRADIDEHDDDLESTVHEGAVEETDTYPDTGDELEGPLSDETEEDPLNLDDDETEL
jgi:hypothetical protein